MGISRGISLGILALWVLRNKAVQTLIHNYRDESRSVCWRSSAISSPSDLLGCKVLPCRAGRVPERWGVSCILVSISLRRSCVSAGPCETSRQSRADDPEAAVFWSRSFLRSSWFRRGSSATYISHFSFCSFQCFFQKEGVNIICLWTSHEIHRSWKGRNTFTLCSISASSLLLGVFRIYWSSRCLEICLGLIIFLLTYRASLSSNQFSPNLDWVPSWKTVFPSEVLSLGHYFILLSDLYGFLTFVFSPFGKCHSWNAWKEHGEKNPHFI